MKIIAITPDGEHDYLAAGIIEGLYKIDGLTFKSVNRGNGVKTKDKISLKAFKEQKSDSDFIFIFHGKKPGNYGLLKSFTEEDWSKTVFIDGSEWSIAYTSPLNKSDLVWWEMLENAAFYFKRECYPEYAELGIIPLQLPAVDKDFGYHYEDKTLRKDIDVLCAFKNLKGVPDIKHCKSWRQVAIDACNELKEEGYNIITEIVDDKEYFKYITRSRIVIDAYGGGEWNARTLQISANMALPFIKEYNIITPNFEPLKNYIPWRTSEHLKANIRSFLEPEQKKSLKELTIMYHNRVKEHHTSEARAKYVIDKITEVI